MHYSIKKIAPLRSQMSVPGDKSISHRSVMFSALANGKSEISGLALGLDVKSTINCLKQLGITPIFNDGKLTIEGHGLLGFRAPKVELDAGNSGTTIRLMAGILAGQHFSCSLIGDESLTRRPMRRILEPLKKMGANISGIEDNFAPLTIHGSVLSSHRHRLKVASAQVKSCLLLAGMYAQGTTSVTEPYKSRDHTERMLSYLGADIGINSSTVTIEGFPLLKSAPIFVPGDISSAAFFIVAATLIPHSKLIIQHVGLNPTRTGILEVLKIMGARITYGPTKIQNYESCADLQIEHAELKGTTISKDMIPRVIDELPIIAVLATQAEGETIIRDAQELRVKETDRIQAIVTNLRRMGGIVEELPDGMIIPGPQTLHSAVLDSFGDHRIAMAFAIAGAITSGETRVENAECVDISYPGFFMQLEDLDHG
ncbi:3-phosphoshikimate 1-carboxyvinyltransferase [candidate division KSB1 bacterium]|nr:3-phosphoshikimate 1-carboxyvinyltransferase [candidate division KSB1 bacterium]